MQTQLSWSERGTICPEVASSIPAKTPKCEDSEGPKGFSVIHPSP